MSLNATRSGDRREIGRTQCPLDHRKYALVSIKQNHYGLYRIVQFRGDLRLLREVADYYSDEYPLVRIYERKAKYWKLIYQHRNLQKSA